MTTVQKVIKYLAVAFAIILIVGIIEGAVSILGLFTGSSFRGDAVAKDIKTYTISSDVRSLKMNINAADIKIKQADAFSLESNLNYLTVEETDGVLTISERKKLRRISGDPLLTLYIPASTVFDRAYITTGAGKLTIDRLSAGRIDLDLGAGEVNIDTLIATSDADIDGGAGKITISDGALHNLEVDMGVGQFNLTSALTGRNKLDLGIGESNITIIGDRDAYTLDIEKGLGSITLDGTPVSSMKDLGSAQNSVEVDGGIGAIHVKFVKNT